MREKRQGICLNAFFNCALGAIILLFYHNRKVAKQADKRSGSYDWHEGNSE